MKRKNDIEKVLLLFIFATIVILFISEGSSNILLTNNVINKVKYEITDSSESDKEIIKEEFAKGMDTKDYINIINNNMELINEKGAYNLIEYNFENRLNYNKIEKYIHEMSKSSIVNAYIIGKSLDNRNIYNIEIGSGDKVLLIDAGIHAAESANTHILMKFLIDILNDYEQNDKNIVELLKRVKIAAIPCINPDGYELYGFGIDSIINNNLWIYQNKDIIDFKRFKYNTNGIDINRNFPTQNAGLYYTNKKLHSSVSFTKTTDRKYYYAGDTLGSESETKAAIYQILTHYKSAYAYINLHSQGRVMYCGKPNLSNEFNRVTSELCNRIGKFTNYKIYGPSREEVGEGNDGTISDFVAELANGFVFSIETGRLSTDKYVDNSSRMVYSIPVAVIETMDDNYKDQQKFKEEYYNHGIKEMLYDLLRYGND